MFVCVCLLTVFSSPDLAGIMSAAAAYVPAMATSSTPLDLARPHKTLGEDKMCLREDKGTPERKPMRRISGVSGEGKETQFAIFFYCIKNYCRY